MLLTLGLAHLVSPVLAYLLGSVVFGSNSPYVVGLVLFTVIPLGVSSIIWVGLSQGSVPLILALVVLDAVISPVVVPHAIEWTFGQLVTIDTMGVMLDLIWIVVLPTALGVAVYEISKGQAKERTASVMLPTSKLAFLAVILLNASAIAPFVEGVSQDMMKLVPMVILLVALCYGVGAVGSRWLTKGSTDASLQVTVAYATGMRNISLGIVIAMGYFSPQASIPVVLSILVQQRMATAYHALHKILTLRCLAKKGMSRYDKR
ncbi:bile acid:sodium symporter family protein [Paenibacillus guangzhouensis]|uniref:bile acid:sodium symporter family protein n=1 Tax=Paenibacillus guangzhouensis TaxID=1473112 RepID=UPI0022392EF9|nr:bile acid:sodium symporter family protein [Paenibacillus guangzhouensis]